MSGVLLLRELHQVRGACADDFAAAFRDGWMPAVERHGFGRLLWYWDLPHGSGPAYTVVTLTALEGGAAWEALVDAVPSRGAATSNV